MHHHHHHVNWTTIRAFESCNLENTESLCVMDSRVEVEVGRWMISNCRGVSWYGIMERKTEIGVH